MATLFLGRKMPPRVFRILSIAVILLLSGGVLLTGSALAFWANAYCLHFVEFYLVGFGVAAFLWSCLGLFFLLKNYRRLYILYVVFRVLLALCLLGTLVVFWTFVATNHGRKNWWIRRYVTEDRWSSMELCLRSTHFCRQFPAVHGCCQEPLGCDRFGDGLDPDCFRWGGTNETLCYLCFSCRRDIVYRLRADGRRVEVALVMFTLLMVFMDMTLLVVEYFRRGALPSPELPLGEQDIAAGVAQGEQDIAAGVAQREQEPATGAAEADEEPATA